VSADIIVLPVVRVDRGDAPVTMKIEVPGDIYAALLRRAFTIGEPVENVVSDLIASCVFELDGNQKP
jgi:ATP-dependent protease Clp ATPase subunit